MAIWKDVDRPTLAADPKLKQQINEVLKDDLIIEEGDISCFQTEGGRAIWAVPVDETGQTDVKLTPYVTLMGGSSTQVGSGDLYALVAPNGRLVRLADGVLLLRAIEAALRPSLEQVQRALDADVRASGIRLHRTTPEAITPA